jgi:hypothetical protein
MSNGQERLAQLLIAGRQATHLFQLVEEALHFLASLVLLRGLGPGFLRIALGRNDRHYLPILQMLAKLIAVLSFVHNCLGQLRQHGPLGQDRPTEWCRMAGTTGQLQGDTGVVVEAADMDVGGTATPRASHSLCHLPAGFFRAPAAC